VFPFKLWINSAISVLVLILYANLAKKLVIKSYFLEKFRQRYGFYPMTREDKEDEELRMMRDELEGKHEASMIDSAPESSDSENKLEKKPTLTTENKYMKRMRKGTKLKSEGLKENMKGQYFRDLMANADKDAAEAGQNDYDRSPHYYKTQRAYDDYEVKGWEFLREEISPKTSFMGGMINELYLLRDLILCAVILSFMNYPKLQFFPLIPIFGFFSFFILKHKPFKRKAMNRLSFLNELGYMMLAILLATLDLFKNKLDMSTKYNLIGMLMIGIITTIMVTNLGISVGIAFLEMKEWCLKEKERKRLKKELQYKREKEQRLDESALGIN
jgi:hypothetical protein